MVRTITIKYFGVLSELTGKTVEQLVLKDSTSIEELVTSCQDKYPKLAGTSFQVALNKKIVKEGVVQDLDELALLPPFSGG